MVPIPAENGGVDANDEEEEEEKEEPRLKYQRMEGSVQAILTNDAATCISVTERMIALGTNAGKLYILDFLGNKVKEFHAHQSVVNKLSFDVAGEYIGSCSDDGTVLINNLVTDEERKFEFHKPMKAIALDPDYTRKSSRRFVTGGLAGQLIFYTKTWFGYKNQVLHSGEGPIHAITWRNSLIAWANDVGVKVYDVSSNHRLTLIERPQGIPHREMLLPHLVWQDDNHVVVGWGTSVRIASIRSNQNRTINGTKQVDIVVSFETSYYISGIAPFGDSLVILGYILREEESENEFSSIASSRQVNAERPEVRVVSRKNDELATDALPVYGFENYKAKDYSLAHIPFSGDEYMYYVLCPKDMIIAKPRDVEDHISWIVQHGWHEKVLVTVEAGQGRCNLLEERLHILVGRLRDMVHSGEPNTVEEIHMKILSFINEAVRHQPPIGSSHLRPSQH